MRRGTANVLALAIFFAIGVRAVGFSGDKSNVSNALHILVGPPIDPNALVPPSSFRVVP